MSVLLKYTIGIVLALLLATPANAYPCGQIRAAVQSYGIQAVISWAYQQGYTRHQILAARRACR